MSNGKVFAMYDGRPASWPTRQTNNSFHRSICYLYGSTKQIKSKHPPPKTENMPPPPKKKKKKNQQKTKTKAKPNNTNKSNKQTKRKQEKG